MAVVTLLPSPFLSPPFLFPSSSRPSQFCARPCAAFLPPAFLRRVCQPPRGLGHVSPREVLRQTGVRWRAGDGASVVSIPTLGRHTAAGPAAPLGTLVPAPCADTQNGQSSAMITNTRHNGHMLQKATSTEIMSCLQCTVTGLEKTKQTKYNKLSRQEKPWKDFTLLSLRRASLTLRYPVTSGGERAVVSRFTGGGEDEGGMGHSRSFRSYCSLRSCDYGHRTDTVLPSEHTQL